MNCNPPCFSSPDPLISNFFFWMMKNCQMDPLLGLIPGSCVHLLLLLVLATGIPLSKRTAKVHLSQHGSLPSKLNAVPCPKTQLLKLSLRERTQTRKHLWNLFPTFHYFKKVLFGFTRCLVSIFCQSHCWELIFATSVWLHSLDPRVRIKWVSSRMQLQLAFPTLTLQFSSNN